MDATAKQAKDLLDLVGTPSALIGGTLLAFASRGIKENLAKVDRTKMLFAFLAGLAAMGVAGSLVALMTPIGWRAISTSDHGGATLVVFWMILLSIAGSFIYATLITKRCIDELRRPSH